MLKAKTRWQLATYDEALADEIARVCGISPLIARLLVIRGIDSPERAKAFLHVGVEQFHDPYLLDGMARSVERIREAIKRGEPICIYGDYDADGVSSTALMYHTMKELGATFDYYIPNRFKEGYGLNKEALTQLHAAGYKLIVTVDTGISAVEQVEHAKALGLDVIVTDHHEPPAVIPDALAVINPKKPGCPYPFDMLAGVGVAFKLAHALLEKPPVHLMDLAAIGTIADLVPLVEENRVLASLGLRRLNQTRNVGLKALIRVCGLADTPVTAGHVGFAIGPRINASGRLETAEAAVKLLTTDDPTEAEHHAQTLDALNQERQELVQAITEEAIAMVQADFPPEKNGVLVVAKEGWNVGVVGIVASRLVEKFYRPTIVLGIDPEKGIAKGSARSIAGFDMYEALTACKEWLPHFGGHTMAAGMTLPVENLPALRERLNQLAAEWLTEEDFIPLTKVDLAIGLDQIDIDLAGQMEALAPFGIGNPTPLIVLSDVEPQGLRRIGRDESHLKCAFCQGGQALDAIGFQWAEVLDHIAPKARLQVVGELDVNEWNGVRKPQLVIRDLAISHRQIFDWRGSREKERKWQRLAENPGVLTVTFREASYQALLASGHAAAEGRTASRILLVDHRRDGYERMLDELQWYHTLVIYDMPKQKAALAAIMARCHHMERIYCLFGDPDLGLELLHAPSRDQFKHLYLFLSRFPSVEKIHLEKMAQKLQVRREMLEGMLAVFQELAIVREEPERYMLHAGAAKQKLENSILYTEWLEESELATELLLSSYDALVRYLNQWVEQPAL
ncbi:single-stranded-DNA-specific exonuclease RecJ [Brevibacillus sp. SYP-B805]|uniref:single-stranded-DNA-specific exonuclease RecJ n=1 Tax=Brevibacillus sp. SYP-B805 TaxID=1578199 RepID=UPI0013ED5BD4|nr:single-stranded-DNA-specific exonuclease RecJ [Brevibacillus sp. SYP-B805]NGQ94257.1 single-stranded-DNA-specific exonuclease RecJ [Brevibacillus sp. SYP-B805]